jgi:hypothetical protein
MKTCLDRHEAHDFNIYDPATGHHGSMLYFSLLCSKCSEEYEIEITLDQLKDLISENPILIVARKSNTE